MRVDPKGYFVYWHDLNQVSIDNDSCSRDTSGEKRKQTVCRYLRVAQWLERRSLTGGLS